jgi:hypothetical protein
MRTGKSYRNSDPRFVLIFLASLALESLKEFSQQRGGSFGAQLAQKFHAGS